MEYSEMANTQNTPAGAGSVDEDFIPVLTPKNLRVDRLPARRIALGQLDDQKPSLVLLPDGQLLLSWGEPGKGGPGEFHLPHGITIDRDGRVLVCDRENNRIQIYDQEGNYLDMWDGFLQPASIAQAPNGSFFVPELQHRVTVLSPKGDVMDRWGGESSREPGRFVAPHDVAVDSKGDVYVGEVLEGKRVQKFVRT